MKHKIDNRPRFGWAHTLDNDPQIIYENPDKWIADDQESFPVAIVPLPYMSGKLRQKVRNFIKKQLPPL